MSVILLALAIDETTCIRRLNTKYFDTEDKKKICKFLYK